MYIARDFHRQSFTSRRSGRPHADLLLVGGWAVAGLLLCLLAAILAPDLGPALVAAWST